MSSIASTDLMPQPSTRELSELSFFDRSLFIGEVIVGVLPELSHYCGIYVAALVHSNPAERVREVTDEFMDAVSPRIEQLAAKKNVQLDYVLV